MSEISPAQAAYEAYRRAEVSPLRPQAQALALAGREWAALDESDRDWWAAAATAAIDTTGLEDERDKYRELLDEIGVIAANAPEDGDSFGLLEQIAMRIAAIDVPDSTPIEEWPDPENPVTGRTPGAAPGLAAMAETQQLREQLDEERAARLHAVGQRDEACSDLVRACTVLARVLGEFKRSGSGHSARLGQVTIARAYRDGGLPLPADLTGIGD